MGAPRYVEPVFDLSMGEILLIAIVLLVVVGPRELPTILRQLGRMVAKLRNMSWELREQSGIDQVIKDEGLERDIDAIRSLSRGRVVDAIVSDAMGSKTVKKQRLEPNGPAASKSAGAGANADAVKASSDASAGSTKAAGPTSATPHTASDAAEAPHPRAASAAAAPPDPYAASDATGAPLPSDDAAEVAPSVGDKTSAAPPSSMRGSSRD